MYYNYWNLHKPPFDNVPDPSMYVDCHASLENAIAETLFAIEEGNDCLAVIVGDVGLGKTLSIRMVMDSLSRDQYNIALVTNPGISFIELLREIIGQLTGMVCLEKRKAELFEQFNKILFETADVGKKVLIFIDEANAISPANLESLRLLTNMQDDSNNLFTIILAGQIELARRLEHPKRANLFQRIGTFSRIDKIGSVDLVKTYVETRLRLAGSQTPIFTDEAVALIWDYSEQGVPRLINKIAKLCLKAGETNGFKTIDAEIVQQIGDRFRNLTGQVVQKRKPRRRMDEVPGVADNGGEPFMIPTLSDPLAGEGLSLVQPDGPTARIFTLCPDETSEGSGPSGDDVEETGVLQVMDRCMSAADEEPVACMEEASSDEPCMASDEAEPLIVAEATGSDTECLAAIEEPSASVVDNVGEDLEIASDDVEEAVAPQVMDLDTSAMDDEPVVCAEEPGSDEPCTMPIEAEPLIVAEATGSDTECLAAIEEPSASVVDNVGEDLEIASDDVEEAVAPQVMDLDTSAMDDEPVVCAEEPGSDEPCTMPVEAEPLIVAEATGSDGEAASTVEDVQSPIFDSADEPSDVSSENDEDALSREAWYVSPSVLDEAIAESLEGESRGESLMIAAQAEPLVDRALAVVEAEARVFMLRPHSDEAVRCVVAEDGAEDVLPQALERCSSAVNDELTESPCESFQIQGVEVVVDIPRDLIRDALYMKEDQVLKSAGVLAAQVLKEHRELTSDPGADPFLLWDDIRKILMERLQREGRGSGNTRLAVL